jgi:hypothetical protein
MGLLGLVEVQGASDAVDDAVGDAGGVAALELGVVLAWDARQQRDLVAAQSGDPSTLCTIRGKTGLLGADPGPSRGQNVWISPRTLLRASFGMPSLVSG